MKKSGANLVIIGTSGHAKVVYEAFRLGLAGKYRFCGFITSDRMSSFMRMPVLGSDKEAGSLFKKYGITHAFVAVGAGYSREHLTSRLLEKGMVDGLNIIHPSAVIAGNVKIGTGNFIGPGAIVNTCATLGDHCVVNSGAIIEHDCLLGDFSTVCPGVTVGGKSSIGKRSFIGLGASVIHRVSIGADTVIGAGAVVVGDIAGGLVVAGCPAKVLNKRKKDDPYL